MATRQRSISADALGVMTDVQIATVYATVFGEAGDFDTWLLPPQVNAGIMRQALQRGAPVSDEDLTQAHEALYQVPPGELPPDAVT
jgi:hypothetical protein